VKTGVGFDNTKYLDEQTRAIFERMDRVGGRLYLEFGGKIAYDFHAARVLPGHDPNARIQNPSAMVAMERLKSLAGCEFHTTHIPTAGDEAGLRRLGVNVTSEPNFASRSLVIS
jgi:uncharacterized protein (UPF0371 family)